MRRHLTRALALAAALAACLGAADPAAANRALSSEALLDVKGPPAVPQGQIEGACGLAVTSSGQLAVSDYYHRAVDFFTPSGGYVSQFLLPGGAISGLGVNTLDGTCGLASDSAGRLYANEWHQRVSRLQPSALAIDEGHESTGVAVDPSTDWVYVDDRTYVAVYEPSGAPVEAAGLPLRIGLGSLENAYGVAASGGRVYVPDAASNTIEVFEPAANPAVPVASISHDFVSLIDAAVAVDPTNGHLVVADNPQPGFERPGAALHEFDSAGASLGQLFCAPVNGEPSGLAFDSAGNFYVTDGNGEAANVFKYGPYTTGSVPTPPCAATALAAPGGGATAGAVSAARASGAAVSARIPRRKAPLASSSTVVQQGGVRVSFDGGISPQRLPRHGSAGVRLSVETKIAAADGSRLPALRKVSIGFNRAGRIHPGGLPICSVSDIQPSTNAAAREACGDSIVGRGTFSADVRIPRQSPFPARGQVIAFNGRYRGRPAILAHVYGTVPVPTSFTLPFAIKRSGGTFGTVLVASLPRAAAGSGYVTGLKLDLGRTFRLHGISHSYLTAGCPAPSGFGAATFPLTRAILSFGGGPRIATTVDRTCRARG